MNIKFIKDYSRKIRKSIYILESKSRKLIEKILQNRVVSFKITTDERKLFVITENASKIKSSELIVFDIK